MYTWVTEICILWDEILRKKRGRIEEKNEIPRSLCVMEGIPCQDCVLLIKFEKNI